MDVGTNGGDGSDGSSGGFGGDSDFSVSDLLGPVVSSRFSRCLRGVAFVCLCPFLWHLKQSSSLMHQAQSARENFFRWTALTSMASGSLAEHGLEENKERGRPFPFLKAMMRAFCLWKLMAFSIQALRVVGTFSME